MPVERSTFKVRRFRCQSCDGKAEGLFWNYDPAPICAEHGAMHEYYPTRLGTLHVIGDEFPGGMEVPHVLCSEDGMTPGIVYSKSELRARLAEKGWTIDGETPNVRPEHQEQQAREREERRAKRDAIWRS